MHKLDELSRCLTTLEGDRTLIAVIEMSQLSWVVAGIAPGVERQPLKKLAADEGALLKLLNRWRQESEKAGCRIERIAAGRDRSRCSPESGPAPTGDRHGCSGHNFGPK